MTTAASPHIRAPALIQAGLHKLDFGVVAFDRDARWSRIEARHPAGQGPYQPLSGDVCCRLTVVDEEDSEEWVLAKATKEIANHRLEIRTSAPRTSSRMRFGLPIPRGGSILRKTSGALGLGQTIRPLGIPAPVNRTKDTAASQGRDR